MNDKKPLISVIMSAYSEPSEFVSRAVESILSQTLPDFEFIIVLDKPENSELKTLLESYAEKDKRIRLLINEKNIGLAMSLNRGISEAKGKYLARMDADDIALPERFAEELEFLEKNSFDVVGCVADKIDENGNVWGEIKPFSSKSEAVAALMPVQNALIHPTVMMKAETVRAVGCYRNFASCQDYDLWLRLLTAGYKIGILDKKLFKFRRHRQSITATRRFNQVLNEEYIRKLYSERLSSGGQDSFSEQNLEAFLRENGFYDEKKFKKENESLQKYTLGVKELKQRKPSGAFKLLSAVTCKSVRTVMRNTAKAKKIKKRFS